MEHMRTPIACLALLIQHAASAALPISDREISSISNKPRNDYESSGNSDEAGAKGSNDGSINLKKRDEVAIIVVAALVVVIGG